MASYAPNPALVAAIRQQGPDPDFQAVLLATSLAESGGRLDAIGDSGNSGGPYQENSAGRGAGIPMPQRFDPSASTRRAVAEFSRYRTADPGVWAARAQRPADPEGYAVKVRQLLPVARQILGGAPAGPTVRAAAAPTIPGGGLSPASMKRIGAYLRRSEADVMAGRDPGDVTALLRGLDFSSAPPAPGLPSGARLSGYTLGGGPDAHGARALGNWQSDTAYDVMGRAGAAFPLPFAGRVTRISGQPGGPPQFAGYGVTVAGPGGNYFVKHLGALGPGVAVGARIRPGQVLGTLEPSTRGGPHAHVGAEDPAMLTNLMAAYGLR